MDEGFVEDYDPSDNVDGSEATLTHSEYVLYKKLWFWRKHEYLCHKNDFLFHVKMAFYTMDAFDFGIIDFDTFRARMVAKTGYLRRYEQLFDIPFQAFELLFRAAIGEVEITDDIELIYSELYNVVFPH